MADNKEVITLFVALRETKNPYFYVTFNVPYDHQMRVCAYAMLGNGKFLT